jgi:SAM-dependent methyltransferase
VMAIVFFGVTLSFIGPGQIMGRCFRRFKPVQSYSINLLGSLAGILLFTGLAYFRASAWTWFAVAFAVLLIVLRKLPKKPLILGAALLAFSVGMVAMLDRNDSKTENFWSLYYHINKIIKKDDKHPVIVVNLIGHQQIQPLNEKNVYSIPYWMLNKTPGKKFKDILIIGAGSGNDVNHALFQGAESIDAVEIDPLINELGKKYHPEKPFANPKVRVFIDDGRSYLKKTDKKYDLVIYALVDSLTLLSTYSNIRLENFLFTKEAFEDVRRRLKPDGTFVVYNFFRTNWLVMRIGNMMTTVFGEEPVLVTEPPLKSIRDGAGPPAEFSIMMVGNTAGLKKNFDTYGSFVVDYRNIAANRTFNGFTAPKTAPGNKKLETYYRTKIIGEAPPRLPDDNWPFLYLRAPSFPKHNLVGVVLILSMTLLVFALFARGKVSSFNPHFFLLGAAFMLLETESIVKLSLIYGSTWFVNSIVFFTLLLMVYLANLIISAVDIKKMYVVYILLIAAIAANYFIPLGTFLGRGGFVEWVLPPMLLFCPMIFAGLIFPTSFKKSRNPAADLGTNLLGVMAGGLIEYTSVMWGYSALLIVVGLLYLSAYVFTKRGAAPAA